MLALSRVDTMSFPPLFAPTLMLLVCTLRHTHPTHPHITMIRLAWTAGILFKQPLVQLEAEARTWQYVQAFWWLLSFLTESAYPGWGACQSRLGCGTDFPCTKAAVRPCAAGRCSRSYCSNSRTEFSCSFDYFRAASHWTASQPDASWP